MQIIISLEFDCFHCQGTQKICIAGLNFRVGYATEKIVFHVAIDIVHITISISTCFYMLLLFFLIKVCVLFY